MVASWKKAYKFFHRYTIPRRARDVEAEESIIADGQNPRIIWRHAGAHEDDAEPYPVFNPTTADLGPFGVGIALYFKQLQWLSFAFLLYGCISLYNIFYYASDKYDSTAIADDYITLLPGSAYCNNYVIVAATVNCVDNSASCDATYAENCQVERALGMWDMMGIMFLIVYCAIIGIIQEKEQEIVDESVQTCQDYAVTVLDPGPNDDDPEEWRSFFSQFGEVMYITIARANSKLLTALATRRSIHANIALVSKMNLDSDSNESDSSDDTESEPFIKKHAVTESTPLLMDNDEDDDIEAISVSNTGKIWQLAWKLGLVKHKDDWEKDLKKVNMEIKALSKQKFPVTRVYCVFNTEKAKRNCLEALTTGTLQSAFNWKNTKNPEFMFRGTNVLSMKEPSEPSEVLWQNLELDWKYCTLQSLVSALISLIVVYIAYLAIYTMKQDSSSEFLAVGVSVINSILPYVCYWITGYERHKNQSSIQNSLMIKLVIARFMNTALISYLTTNQQDTLSYEALATIQALMISDAFITPTIAAMDLYNNFYRHFISRLSFTQRQMNTYFLGSPWDLAERYTSMLKTVFVALFYATLYPAGLFFASFCLMYTYIVDRYMLTRLWRRAPAYDAQLARKVLKIIIFSLFAHVVVSFVWYAEWPFDSSYISANAYVYVEKINQYSSFYDIVRNKDSEWMTDVQRELISIYWWVGMLLFVTFIVYICYIGVLWVISLFAGNIGMIGDDQRIPFNRVDRIEVYVPTCTAMSDLVGDLVACNVVNLAPSHYPSIRSGKFKDPKEAFDNANVALQFPLRKRKKMFGIVHGFN